MNDDDLSDDLFGRLALFLLNQTGIVLKNYKKYLVVSRLAQIVGTGKRFSNYTEYYQALTKDPALVQEFINALTTNYSFFFRDTVHFSAMEQYLRENASHQPYLRFWSAASSTGEEAFSMAITLSRFAGPLPQDRRILATDISTKVLTQAEAGSYGIEAVQRHVSDEDQKRYFTYDEQTHRFIVKPVLRSLVDFRQLNLQGTFPFRKEMDIIFLRNVMIYFGPAEKRQILERMYDHLKPGGLLILGLSESTAGIPHKFVTYRNSIHMKPAD